MKKTYSGRDWEGVDQVLGMAIELGMFSEARLKLSEEQGDDLTWDLTLHLTGFDSETAPEPVVEKRVEFSPVVSTTEPEVIDEWIAAGEARIEAAGAVLVEPSEAEGGTVIGEPEPELVVPITTEPRPPAEPPPKDGAEIEPKDVLRQDFEIPEGMKLCITCGPEVGPKPLSEFGINRAKKDGHSNKCKECTRAYRRQWEQRQKKERSAIKEQVAEERQAADEGAQSTSVEEMAENLKTNLRVTVLPRAERVSEPEEIAAQPRTTDKVERFCVNDTDCVHYSQIDGPAKLAERNTDGRCFACQEADVGSPGSPKMIVRHAADGSTR